MQSSCMSASLHASSNTSGSCCERCRLVSLRDRRPTSWPMPSACGLSACGVTAVVICDSRGRSGSAVRRHVHMLHPPLPPSLVNEWPLNCLNTISICMANFVFQFEGFGLMIVLSHSVYNLVGTLQICQAFQALLQALLIGLKDLLWCF